MMQFNATFIVALFSFVFFIMLMNAILYKPVSKIVNERENLINKNYADAKEANENADSIRQNREEKLLKSKNDSQQIIRDKVAKAQEEAKGKTDKAIFESREAATLAKENLHNEELAAQEKLQQNISNLAEDITEKILGERIPLDNTEIVSKV